MKQIVLLFVFLLSAVAVPSVKAQKPVERPRLVVGIVVDQMRYDYLYRYWDYYGKGGIKRLLDKGYSFEQAYYPYAPTVTACGHASIFSGSTPAFHGIAGNNWRDRTTGKNVYCVEDSTTQTVGAPGKAGQMSPKNLQASTMTDELKFASRGRSKVISVSMKDRSSVLMAGHQADAAYWFDYKTGNWITSSYYQKQLPNWLTMFNTGHSIDSYAKGTWTPLLSPAQYLTGAGEDSSEFEAQVAPGAGTRMPVNLGKYFKGDNYEIVYETGLSIHATTDIVLTALENEGLGKSPYETDMLCINYSGTDAVGHGFGPDSWEIMDTYLRLDQDLKKLMEALDKSVGKDKYLLFLTADHGGAINAGISELNRMPSGRYSMKEAIDAITARLTERYGEGAWVIGTEWAQVYLDRNLLKSKKISIDEAASLAAEAVKSLPWVHNAWAGWGLKAAAVSDPFAKRLALGSHPERSGDVYIQQKPGYVEARGTRGTKHYSPYAYDTHVPMLFYGWHVPKGSSVEAVEITDIAPTVSALLHIQVPNCTIGKARVFAKD